MQGEQSLDTTSQPPTRQWRVDGPAPLARLAVAVQRSQRAQVTTTDQAVDLPPAYAEVLADLA